jgi:hypothetical protein
MADDCCNSFGGRVSIEIDGDRWTPSDADITLDNTNVSTEAKANQDGSACYISKPELFAADISFRNGCGRDWNEVMRKCKVNVTISEDDNNRTHIFTAARFTGKPKYNISTGEITGLQIQGAQYQMIAG